MTITEFLEQRIADDEAPARAASPGGWQYGTVDSVAGGSLYDESRMIGDLHYEQPDDHDGSIVRHLLSVEADANGVHIARHDPARVLVECEAKRAIVALHSEDGSDCLWHYHGAADPCPTLLALAAVYSDHPDYRSDWA